MTEPGGNEERERLRSEREADEQRESRSTNRLIAGYAVAAVAVLAVAVGVFLFVSGGDDEAKGDAHINLNANFGSTNGYAPDERAGTAPAASQVTELRAAAKEAGCELKLKLPDEGHNHIPQGSKTPSYKTNPPTSGAHVEPPFQQADGAYLETPAEIEVVHSLEHGRMAIQYSSDLAEADQLALKGLYDTMYGAALLFPNDEMPFQVAATTWTNLLGCPTYEGAATLDAIRAFGRATWGKFGGEPVFAFRFSGPTPEEPSE
jgi:hypothetical protein